MSASWEESSYLEFKELKDEMSQFVDKSKVDVMLRIQLEEVEMLQSMFSNPGEFDMYDPSAFVDIKRFLDGKCNILPPRLDFTINLTIDDKKLKVCVSLPLNYPADEPDIFVRNDLLSRNQQHELNGDLSKYINSLKRGEICIYPAVAWLQENASSFFISNEKAFKLNTTSRSGSPIQQFSRHWIYSHHIYSKIKRRCIMDLAQENNVTGFCLPGRPGIICVEGRESDCNEWWQRIRCMNWKKIVCKNKEQMRLADNGSVDLLRKFSSFHEITFDSGKNKSRDHMDMGEFYKYLSTHDCAYIFKDYFGFDGKLSGDHVC